MHCRFSHTLSVTQYLFILFLVRWRGMVAPSVYRTDHVCGNIHTVAALCSSWLESAEPLRMATSVWIKLDDHTVDVGIICKCMLPAQLPILFRKVRTPSIPGTTFIIRSLPGLGRIQQNYLVSDVWLRREERAPTNRSARESSTTWEAISVWERADHEVEAYASRRSSLVHWTG
jgi:hypothetical protein